MSNWLEKLKKVHKPSENQAFGETMVEKPLERKNIPTRRPTVDFVTSGGFPNYGISVIAGTKHSGKTTLAFQAANEFEGDIGFLDTEYTTDGPFLESLGVDPNRVRRFTADDLETMIDILLDVIPYFKVIVWDSYSNIASREENAKEAGDRTRATGAIVMSTQVKRLNAALYNHGCHLIVISHVSQNQERMNKYDPKHIIPGGERLHHNSHLTLMMFPSTKAKDGKDIFSEYDAVYGRASRVLCQKNKTGAPLRQGKIMNVFGEGFSIFDDIFTSGVSLGVIERNGSWYSYGGTKLGQGEIKAKEMLLDNPELVDEIRGKIYENYIENAAEYTMDDVDEAVEEVENNKK